MNVMLDARIVATRVQRLDFGALKAPFDRAAFIGDPPRLDRPASDDVPILTLNGPKNRDLETAMSTPEFYEDRAQAQPFIDRHQALMWEVGDLMHQWEELVRKVET